VFVEDEDKLPASLFFYEISTLNEVEEIGSCSLIDNVICLHNLANRIVFITMLHHIPENVSLTLVDSLYFLNNCFCCVLLALLLFKIAQEVIDCRGNTGDIILIKYVRSLSSYSV